jgi:integrase
LGELLGLQWKDINLGEGVLNVQRQYSRTGELAEPKTPKALRRVPLSSDMVAFLKKHQLASRFSKNDDFVFASKAGGPLSHRNVQRRGFEAARDLAELPTELTFHDLRHAFASIAAHRGVPMDVLSEVMGHTNIGVTQKVYIHLYGREEAEAAFRAAMGGLGDTNPPMEVGTR